MSGEMNFGRQLKPVTIEVIGGDLIDRQHWAQRLCAMLQRQPCVTTAIAHGELAEIFHIYPDANND